LRTTVAFGVALGVLVFALPAFANAPNPGQTTVDQVTVNPDGSRTVTVSGTWTWASDPNCATDRDGIGYQIDWFDNQANQIGQANDPDGVLYVGTATDDIVHSDEVLGGSAAFGNAFWDGVPSSYLSHNASNPAPTQTDASNWVSQCANTNSSGVPAGTWGPISHTYAASFTGPITLCPILYDPHGSGNGSNGKVGSSSTNDITAGKNASANNYNTDNSYETNGNTPNPSACPKIVIPTITTSASSATSGNPIHDAATVTGSNGAAATITWNVYAASDNSCSTPLNSSPLTQKITGDGTYNSPDYTPSSTGDYQWVASYSNATINGIQSACNDPNEVSHVKPATPSLVTSASSAVVGQTIQDVATLSGGDNPTGTITWNLYGPGDSSCTSVIKTFTDSSVSGDGNYTSPSYTTTTTGNYHWVASYGGDSNNGSVSGHCGDAGETSNVTPVPPTIATSASSGVVGQSIQDVATLSGGDNPTGTITWKLYGPGDSSCTSAIKTLTDSNVRGDGNYTSPSYTTTQTGDYQWVASYGGDVNNSPVSGNCGDQGETSHMIPAQPTIVTSATSGVVGQSIQDVATLSGGYNPTGAITWNLYGPGDSSCTSAIKTFTDSSVNGDGNYTSPSYVTTQTGDYHWVASYGGDSNNASVSGNCGDPGETSTVSPLTPTLSTNAVNGTTGGPIHDTALLTGGEKPTGTITWNLYNTDSDPTCQTSLGSVSASVNGDGTYTSPDIVEQNAGHYEWVANYSGDNNNNSLSTSCNDPNELSTVSVTPVPAIHLTKLEQVGSTSANGYVPGPVHGVAGDVVDYQMTITNTGNTDLDLNFSDQECDPGTLSQPSVLAGVYNSATQDLAAGGELQYTCSHTLSSSDPSPFVNTASVVGTVPNTGQTVSDQASVDAYIDTPGIKVVKLQRDGTSGSFTANDITASVGDTIYYEIQATNTGDLPLSLDISDPHCDSGTLQGPTLVSGALNGNTLDPGGVAQYTCWHVVSQDDLPSYTNVGTVTGTPPSGPPVHGHGIVVAHITQAGIQVVKLASVQCADLSATFTQPADVEPCNGTWSNFTPDVIGVAVPRSGGYAIPVDYQIRVTNTGNTPLALSVDDPLCDAGTLSGPTLVSGSLNGNTLSAGGAAYYTCTHTLTQNDPNTAINGEPFTNTATVTGTPPSGPPVHGTGIVTVDRQPVQPPEKKHFCKDVKTGKSILWRHWPKDEPKACIKPPPHHHKPHPRKPKHPHGFTG
jgi:hypothetical protein